MNRKQKIVLYVFLSIIIISFVIWIIYGGEIFTKTQVMIETKDELFGWTERKWVDKFVWGLDLSLLLSLFSIITGVLLIYLFREKKNL
ncbi:MAG: hypothetical protein QHH13_03640 [Melioribacter sp.]|uniref:hypothetical protein n=1 Tax=Rosettibacter primus TaxID=3111523 RepID=UPI00247EE401|nr:hypothetical protein [Melioribacter sp.]